jgi:hypothetical protein
MASTSGGVAMRPWRWLSLVTALVVLAGLAVARPAPAAFRDCGVIRFSGTRTHIVVLRGTTCATAKRAAQTYGRSFSPPAPWKCALAHAPFRRINGRNVGFSCGYGRGSSNLASRSHAFVGTLA